MSWAALLLPMEGQQIPQRAPPPHNGGLHSCCAVSIVKPHLGTIVMPPDAPVTCALWDTAQPTYITLPAVLHMRCFVQQKMAPSTSNQALGPAIRRLAMIRCYSTAAFSRSRRTNCTISQACEPRQSSRRVSPFRQGGGVNQCATACRVWPAVAKHKIKML